MTPPRCAVNEMTPPRFVILVLFIFIGPVAIFAQRDFRPGYVITSNGDTIHGFILYKAVNSSAVCTFKKTETEIPQDFTPREIKSYRFDEGKFFVKRSIVRDSTATEVFLEFLISGKASFYYMRDESDHYYVEKEDGRLIELTAEDKVLTDADGVDFVKPSQYEGKLKALFSDCPAIFPDISKTSLSHASLIKLGKNYHQRTCFNDNCIIFERQRKPVRFRPGIYGGITFNRLKFGCQPVKVQDGVKTAEYGNQLISDFSAGGELGIRLEFENVLTTFEHVSLMMDVAVQYFGQYRLTETGSYDMIRYEGTDYRLTRLPYIFYVQYLDVNTRTYLLKIPLMVNYTFLKGNFRPYIHGGLMNMITFSQNEQFQLERFMLEYGKSVPGYQYGLILSSGIRIYTRPGYFIFFGIDYEYTQTTSVGLEYRLNNNLFGCKMGISL